MPGDHPPTEPTTRGRRTGRRQRVAGRAADGAARPALAAPAGPPSAPSDRGSTVLRATVPARPIRVRVLTPAAVSPRRPAAPPPPAVARERRTVSAAGSGLAPGLASGEVAAQRRRLAAPDQCPTTRRVPVDRPAGFGATMEAWTFRN